MHVIFRNIHLPILALEMKAAKELVDSGEQTLTVAIP